MVGGITNGMAACGTAIRVRGRGCAADTMPDRRAAIRTIGIGEGTGAGTGTTGPAIADKTGLMRYLSFYIIQYVKKK